VLTCALVLPGAARAQRLPIEHYGVADGLPHTVVQVLFQDSHGLLWIGTVDGLGRYDGHTFVSYGAADGLPSTSINNFFEDAEGRLWIATNGGGVARLLDRPVDATRDGKTRVVRFETFPIDPKRPYANRVNAVGVDSSGAVWCVTDDGAYRGRAAADGSLPFERVREGGYLDWTHAIAQSARRLWLGHLKHLLEIADGQLIDRGAATTKGSDADGVLAIVRGDGDRVFVATPYDVSLVEPFAGRAAEGWTRLPIDLNRGETIQAMSRAGDTLWIGTTGGLIRWRNGAATRFGAREGVGSVMALTVDREGHLWIGSYAGLDMLVTDTAAFFSLAEHGPSRGAYTIVEDHQGAIVASGQAGLVRLDRGALEPLPQPSHLIGIYDRLQQDRDGHWWVGNAEGLWWIAGPALDLLRAQRVGGAHGFRDGTSVFRIVQTGGEIWVAAGTSDEAYSCAAAAGAPRCRQRLRRADALLDVATLPDGGAWLARYAGLARLDAQGVLHAPVAAGLPETAARRLLIDRRGRLWIGWRSAGLSFSDNPADASPVFRTLSVADGLAANHVLHLVEARNGRIYAGTDRGIDEIDPATNRIRHLGPSAGIDDAPVYALVVDRSGQVWVSQPDGVIRFVPAEPGSDARPRGPYLTRVTVRGADRLRRERGSAHLTGLSLAPAENDISFEFGAVGFSRASLRYQFRLEPIQTAWSAPSAERSVNFVRLPPGRYRFRARAVAADGTALPSEAVAEFSILPPMWRQWWFVVAVALTVAGTGYAAHRARVRRLLVLERTRQQIATDLHDDVGAGLVEIAILGELARRDAPAAAAVPLARVAELARSMRESMADIVWSIDPERDRLADVVQRLRDTAFSLAGIESGALVFRAPSDATLTDVNLAPDRRRHLLLLFKEILANVVKHAGDCRVTVDVQVSRERLTLDVEDDGCGFDPEARSEGNGLRNLTRRAESLGAALQIASAPGRGTRVHVSVPLARPPIWVVGRASRRH
jgi:signal transduction histidine kinase/ligand-binding sensor domain-containing protein